MRLNWAHSAAGVISEAAGPLTIVHGWSIPVCSCPSNCLIANGGSCANTGSEKLVVPSGATTRVAEDRLSGETELAQIAHTALVLQRGRQTRKADQRWQN